MKMPNKHQYKSESIHPYSIIIITISIWWVFHNSLKCDFTFDDSSAIVSNRFIHTNSTLWWKIFDVDYWGTPIKSEHSHKSYRPITSLTFRFNYHFDGLNPYGYHLTNIILHIFTSLIGYRFLLFVIGPDSWWPSMLFTLFFAIHPLKSEAVTSIVGRAEILSTGFILLALFFYSESNYLFFAGLTILATLSKEQGITTPCICILIELMKLFTQRTHPKNRMISKIFAISLFLISIVGLRFWFMGGTLPVFTKFDNPASFEETPIRQLTYNYLLPLNVQLVLYPRWLCADWTMNSIPLIRSFDDCRNIWTLVFYLTLLILMIRSVFLLLSSNQASEIDSFQKRTNLMLALILIIIPFLPASNLLFPVGFVLAERVLYTPSIGYALLLALGWLNIHQNFKSKSIFILLNLSTIITLIALGMRTHQRNFDWQNDLTLFTSGLKLNPNNAKLYNNVGHYYERQQQNEKAIEYFRLAALKDPEDLGSELNIARSLIRLNRLNEAEELLWSIKPRVRSSLIKNRLIPHYLNIWINLAHLISLNNSRLHESENLYLEVLSIKNDFIDAYINLGELYIRKAFYEKALETYRKALERSKFVDELKTADLYYNIAVAESLKMEHQNEIQHRKQQKSKSIQISCSQTLVNIAENFVKAIEMNPEHREAMINMAILLQKPEFPSVNQSWYRNFVVNAMKKFSLSNELESFQFNIAITLLDLGGPLNRLEAIDHLKRAIELRPDYRSALYNLALLKYDFKDYESSLHYLEQTLRFHSNYSKAILLQADILSRLNRLDDAEQAYNKVLEIDHQNYEAIHNLCLIKEKTKRLPRNQKCSMITKNHKR
ncbi:transmembrane and TPR repeat-containing protein 3-like [Sarcoptes scabiei]|nr:transmembrane and TPR repeat-containing protein 3-like [Sarcoptes scabiei]